MKRRTMVVIAVVAVLLLTAYSIVQIGYHIYIPILVNKIENGGGGPLPTCNPGPYPGPGRCATPTPYNPYPPPDPTETQIPFVTATPYFLPYVEKDIP